jgi:hypothetical protein
MKWQPPSLSLVWLGTILFVVLELACLWMFHYNWLDRETIQFFATIVGGAFALFAVLKSIEQHRESNADKLIERWNNPDLRIIINRPRPLVEGIYQSADYARPNCDALKSKPEITQMRGDIHTILGLFEEIAIAIFQRSVSKEKLKRFFGAVIPVGYDGLQGFILAERKEDKRHDYFREAQRLVERWTGTKRPEMLP